MLKLLKNKYFLIVFIPIHLFLSFILTFGNSSFTIYSPGSINDIDKYLIVEEGYKSKGSFNSVSVWVSSKPTYFQLWFGGLDKNNEISEKQGIYEDISVSEIWDYSRTLHFMAERDSIKVAYTYANKDITFTNEHIQVLLISPEAKAYKELEIGDVIVKVFDKEIKSMDDLVNSIEGISCDEEIKITILRDRKELEITTSKTMLDDKCLLGVNIINYYEIESKNPDIKIIDTGSGGPSAGLMQTLALYNQLVSEDITRGYKIAGTGGIDEQGNVTSIGAIQKKVVTADRNGAQIFLAPNISDSRGYNLYQLAKEKAEEIYTDMKVVPVKTFEEALNYLTNLEERDINE